MFQVEVRGIFKKTDKQTAVQVILIKKAKLEVISAFFLLLSKL